MSKAIRIRDYLYEEIERLAKQERRSIISQLELLLEQALKLEGEVAAPRERGTSEDASGGARVSDSSEARSSESGAAGVSAPSTGSGAEPGKPVSAPVKRRMYACVHHVPPTKVCKVCDT